MIRSLVLASICAIALAAAIAPAASRADGVVYAYTALPGPLSNCQWFDDHLNDRSTDSIAQLVDLIYNRAALQAGTPLQPGAPVTVTQSGTTTQGAPLKTFTYAGRILCAQADAVTPSAPATSSQPSASPR